MKKLFLLAASLLCATTCHAFDGQIQFTASKDGIEHGIRISHWQDGKKGPSFDYEYSHKGANCNFEAHGKLSAVLDGKGKPTQETWVDDDGKPIGRTIIFSGDNESVNFPAKKEDLLKFFGFGMQLPKDAAKRGCLKNARDFSVVFKNGSLVK